MQFEWRKLRADELRQQAAQNAIVILPIASIEQHGPHLPVEVDSMLGEAVAACTAAKVQALGQSALVLPVLWTGLSEHHMSFGGTITLDNATFAAVVEGVVRSVLRHGFRRIVLLNAHGGNENALRSITDDLTPKLGVPILQFTYWCTPLRWRSAKILETQGGLLRQAPARPKPSMMMAWSAPELCRDRSDSAGKVQHHAGRRRPGRRRRVHVAQHWQPVRLRRHRQPGGGVGREGRAPV